MFPKRRRVSREAFPKLLATGKRVSTPHFSFVVAPGARGYAVVVSKQVARLSVTRHRLKRMVLALLRTLSFPEGVVVFARGGAPGLAATDVAAEIAAGRKKIA